MHVIYRDKSWDLTEPVIATQLLKWIGVLPENVLVVRNEQLITEDQLLKPGDLVKIIAVVSGG